jgi:hypothetical protein
MKNQKRFFYTIIISIFATKICYANLQITEIMPNPKGKDQNREWVEIYNPTDISINLAKWQIDNGKKELSLNGNLESQNYKVINTYLKNSANSIKLNKGSKLVEEIHYSQSKEGKSLSLINSEYVWSTSTKGKQNPEIVKIEGEIEKIFNSYFTISGQKQKIPLTHDLNKELIKLSLRPANTSIVKLETSKNHNQLKEILLLP